MTTVVWAYWKDSDRSTKFFHCTGVSAQETADSIVYDNKYPDFMLFISDGGCIVRHRLGQSYYDSREENAKAFYDRFRKFLTSFGEEFYLVFGRDHDRDCDKVKLARRFIQFAEEELPRLKGEV